MSGQQWEHCSQWVLLVLDICRSPMAWGGFTGWSLAIKVLPFGDLRLQRMLCIHLLLCSTPCYVLSLSCLHFPHLCPMNTGSAKK